MWSWQNVYLSVSWERPDHSNGQSPPPTISACSYVAPPGWVFFLCKLLAPNIFVISNYPEIQKVLVPFFPKGLKLIFWWKYGVGVKRGDGNFGNLQNWINYGILHIKMTSKTQTTLITCLISYWINISARNWRNM